MAGWAIVCPNPSQPNEKLCLFTTVVAAADEIVRLYKLRWNIETDLRSLKRTVGLHQVFGKAASMVEKEIVLAGGRLQLSARDHGARRATSPSPTTATQLRRSVGSGLSGLAWS